MPMTLVIWLFYVLPLWMLEQIKYEGALDFLIVKFVLVEHNNWYTRAWSKWAGWSGPCIVVYANHKGVDVARILKHEYRHCQQQFVFGWTHYILYALVFVFLWAFTNKDPYFDHPFEVDARKHEGQ